MKKILFLILITAFFSCAKDDYKGDNASTPIILKIAPENEKAFSDSGNNLYAVQIYATTLSSDNYIPYAYGLFDNESDIKISLPEDIEYKIESTIVTDGKTLIRHDSLAYYEPFILNNNTPAELTNKFTVSNLVYFPNLQVSKAQLTAEKDSVPDSRIFTAPSVDRYYGELAEFDPGINTTAEINMERMVFGLQLTINNMTRSDVTLILEGTPDSLVVKGGQSSTIDRIYTLPDFRPGKTLDPLFIRVYHKDSDVQVEGQGEFFIKKRARDIITLTVSKTDKTKADYKYEIERKSDFY